MCVNNITGATFDGTLWTPQFVTALDPRKCIACGRCYKICAREVLKLADRGEDTDRDDDDDFDSSASVMTIANGGGCIGCGACSRVCPKGCYTSVALARK